MAFYVPCGIRMNRWTPAATGANYALSSILQPLGAYNGLPSIQADTLVLTGLANRPARPDGPGDHASGTGAFITNAHPFKTNGANISNGISFDQVLANAWRGQTRFSSLELGIDGGAASGDCDSGLFVRVRAQHRVGLGRRSRWRRRPTRRRCSIASSPGSTPTRPRPRWPSARGTARACSTR